MHYPEKKGYSARNLAYMCQFARTFSVEVLQKMLSCKIEKTDNRQRAVCYKNIGQLAICAGSSCTN